MYQKFTDSDKQRLTELKWSMARLKSEYPTNELIVQAMDPFTQVMSTIRHENLSGVTNEVEIKWLRMSSRADSLRRYITSKTSLKRVFWSCHVVDYIFESRERFVADNATAQHAAKYPLESLVGVPVTHDVFALSRAALIITILMEAQKSQSELKYRNELSLLAFENAKSFVDLILSDFCVPNSYGPCLLDNICSLRFGAVRLDLAYSIGMTDADSRPSESVETAALDWIEENMRLLAERRLWRTVEVSSNDAGEISFMWEVAHRRLTVWFDVDGGRYLKSWGKDIATEMEDGLLSVTTSVNLLLWTIWGAQ